MCVSDSQTAAFGLLEAEDQTEYRGVFHQALPESSDKRDVRADS